jgi:hypothetical protein
MTATLSAPLAAASVTAKNFVIALRCGRLANRLVLFANFIALAEEEGHQVTNVTFHSYAHLFQSTRHNIYCQYPVPDRRSLFDVLPGASRTLRALRVFPLAARLASRLNERLPMFGDAVVTLRETPQRETLSLTSLAFAERVAPAQRVYVYGWRFRVPELLLKHAAVVRDYFRPIEPIASAARECIARLRSACDVVVGVHIRGGDYRQWQGGRFFFSLERYAAWMHELREQFPERRVGYLVCSNEPCSASDFPDLHVVCGPGEPVPDLYALAECDYVLGPYSTFSQWSSFYGNKPLFHLRSSTDRPTLDQFQVSDLSEIL